MDITEQASSLIVKEYGEWEPVQYAGKCLGERKRLGQFFTPPCFTLRLLEKLSNLDGIVLDPACGAGGLLAAAVIGGADPKKCYGMELDDGLVDVARERLGRMGVPAGNIIVGDSTKSIPVHADRVIMNPPYGKLHLAILKNVVESMCGNNWEIASLQPFTWIEGALTEYVSADYKKYAPVLQPHVVSIERIEAVDGTANFDAFFFAGIGVYLLKSSGGSFDLLGFAKEKQERFPAMFKCLLDCYCGRLKTIHDASEKGGVGEFVKLSKVHGNPNKKDFYDLISPERKFTRNRTSNSPSVRYLNFETDREAENFRKTVNNNAFFKFLSFLYKFDQNLKFSRYPWLGELVNPRTGLPGFTGEWTDSDLFELFHVGAEEAAEVKRLMQKHLWKPID